MYNDLAWAWPIISPFEDYEEEATRFADILKENSPFPIQTLLHLACGGGHLDYWLKRRFSVTGVDLNPGMLANGAKLNPEVEYLQEDIRTLTMDRIFDAVVCFDSLVHCTTPEDLKACFEAAYRALRPGGCFLTYQEIIPETFTQNCTTSTTHGSDDFEITLIENNYDPDLGDCTFEGLFIYLIRRRGEDLRVEVEMFLGGVFPTDLWLKLMEEAGFSASIHPYEPEPGVRTLMGVKRG